MGEVYRLGTFDFIIVDVGKAGNWVELLRICVDPLGSVEPYIGKWPIVSWRGFYAVYIGDIANGEDT